MRIAKLLKARRGGLRHHPRRPVHRHWASCSCIGKDGRSSRRSITPSPSTAPSRSITRTRPMKRFATKRWFGFLRMQVRVVKRLPAVLTVSHNSKADIHDQMGVALERLTVVPVGVDHEVFKPYGDVVKKKGRLMVTSSSDVPDEGARAAVRGDCEAARRARHRPHRHWPTPCEGSRRPGPRASRSRPTSSPPSAG